MKNIALNLESQGREKIRDYKIAMDPKAMNIKEKKDKQVQKLRRKHDEIIEFIGMHVHHDFNLSYNTIKKAGFL